MSGQGAMIGAAAGGIYGLASGKDPIKSAMMGAAIGGTGGAMGIPGLSASAAGAGAAGAGAATGTGIGASGASLPGVMGASNTAAGVAAQSALPTGLGGGLPSMIPNMVSTPFSSLAPTAGGMGSAGSFMAGQSGSGGIEQFMRQNPYTTQMGYDYLQSQMQPEPPMAMAQSQGLLRGTQMQPQGQQYQVGVPQFSLI